MSRLLIVIDSLGRNNGAHVATRAMIAALREKGVGVDLLLGSRTEDLVGLEGVRQYELKEPTRGFRWFVQGVYRRLKLAPVPRWVVDPWGQMRRVMRRYDTVLVVGENSHFRWLVSGLKGPRKVVFIHTDYVPWKTSCGWAIEDSWFDRLIYRGFDAIAVVGQGNADRFAAYYPEFAPKVHAFHNLFNHSSNSGSKPQPSTSTLTLTPLRLITLSRLEIGHQKQTDRLIRIAAALKRRGCAFDWTIYGKGSASDEAQLKELAAREDVLDVLHFAGFTSEVSRVLADADLHVLLSAYEGEPNVIIEAQLLGVPCVSTDVGAVREIIEEGKTGRLLHQDEEQIVAGLVDCLKAPEMVLVWKRNLQGYRYDNERVLDEYLKLLRV